MALVRFLMAECRLLLGGQPLLWYLGALGLWIAQVAAPLEVVQRHLLPLVWIWPLMVWSRLGTMSRQHDVEPLLDASPRPILRQLPINWLAGVAIAVLTGAPAIVRFALAADGAAGTAYPASIAAAVFVPSLALALGNWSGTPRLFEGVYLMLWYVGPLNGVAPLDFLGVTPAAHDIHAPWLFALSSVPLIATAAVVRLTRLAH